MCHRLPQEILAPELSLFGLKPVHLAGPIPADLKLPQALDPAAPPTAADLAETEDIQLTPAIKAKAQELNNNPVQIHNWVRNTIEYLPTYGSIQGADMTLQTKRGNAFDTASLEIALLRAAGIPARYVYGTIQLPADKAMNWVGGVSKPEAAQNLLGQGGIPSIGLVSGGQIGAIKLEHVWVEAYVDYVPSRGAINKTPDTWIPLDGSYKQYTYTQGMDIKTNVPLDAASLLTQAQSGATVNQAEGWVQNLNQTNVQSALTGYQTQVKTYIDATKPNATVGDVLGTKTILQKNHSILMGTLPYKTLAVGSRMSSLPDNLRHKFQYSLYADDYQRAMGNAVFTYQQSLPNLAGKKVTLSFAPSTQADADTIASYLPKPHADGSPIQPSEFPTSLPAYLIHVTAQLKVEGQVVASGGTYTLGQELVGEGGFTQYDFSGWDLSTDGTIVSGQTSALGLSLQGISTSQLTTLKARLEQTKAKLEAKDVTGLTGDLITGDLLTATVWSYFASLQNLGNALKNQAEMVDLPALSYGFFHAMAVPNRLYGIITTSVRFPGVMMDIGHLRHNRVAKDSDTQTWINYNRMRGQQASALEGAVPEKFFTDASHPGEAVSAVKAIAVASSQGQKIFTITQANAAVALPQLSHRASVMDEIQNAIVAGKEVTISQSSVTVGGWSGAGYIIVDPATGAGAYMIEGGANGAMLAVFGSAAVGIVGMFLLVNGIGPAIFAAVLISIAIHVAIIALAELIADGLLNPGDIFAGSAAALSLLRGIAVLLAGLGIVGFVVPGGLAMGVVLIALAVLGFSKIGG